MTTTDAAADRYLVRVAEPALENALQGIPAVRVRGARGIGKTTTAQRFARQTIDLSDPDQRNSARLGGDGLLSRGPHPILLDEWQEAPDVVWAAKRVIDANPRPGLFIVAGSVEHAQAPDERWPLLVRSIDVRLVPLSVAERLRRPTDALVGRLFDQLPATGTASDLGLDDYFDLLVRGGYPQVCDAPDHIRIQALSRILDGGEVVAAAPRTDRTRFRRFLTASLARTARHSDRTELADTCEIAASTADRYLTALNNAGLMYDLESWRPDALGRVRRKPKRFAADSGLAAVALHMTGERLLKDHQARGALIETFVAMQLRAGVEADSANYSLWYFSDHRREIDFIIEERRTGRCLAIEVKSSRSVNPHDARHIAWLAQRLTERGQRECQLVGGLVLHTGPHAYPLNRPWNEPEEPLFREPLIMAAPISVLWDG